MLGEVSLHLLQSISSRPADPFRCQRDDPVNDFHDVSERGRLADPVDGGCVSDHVIPAMLIEIRSIPLRKLNGAKLGPPSQEAQCEENAVDHGHTPLPTSYMTGPPPVTLRIELPEEPPRPLLGEAEAAEEELVGEFSEEVSSRWHLRRQRIPFPRRVPFLSIRAELFTAQALQPNPLRFTPSDIDLLAAVFV